MHACSAAIEHSLHTIQQQPAMAGHPALLVSSSLSISPSPSSQLQVPVSLQLPASTPNLPLPSAAILPSNASASASGENSSSHPPLFRLSSATHSTSSHTSFVNRLSATEVRLFHTLHFLISDASHQNPAANPKDQLLPLNTIQLFIYLFIPYIHTFLQSNEKEFLSNLDLAQGMRLIWQPLLEYRQPNIRMFSAFVKPMIPSYASPNENGDFLSLITESQQSQHHQHQQQQQQHQTYFINNNKRNRLSVLVESPTPIMMTTKAILEEVDEDQHSQAPSPTQMISSHDYSSTLPRSMSEKQPLSDLTNQPLIMAPIVSSEGSSTSLFQPISALKKDQKSTTSVQADSDTTTTNNSITDLSAYGTSSAPKPRAPLVHMSSICSISDSSRLTTSPQSPGKNLRLFFCSRLKFFIFFSFSR